MKNSAIQLFWRSVFLVVMFGTLLVLAPGTLGQHIAGNRSAGFSGGHVGGFSGGGFQGTFSAPHPFGGFTAPAPRGFGAAPRMNWTAPRYNFVPNRNDYARFRPPYNAGDRRRGDHRERYRHQYPGYGYGGYPYEYVNSWELPPWDLGYPDVTGYGDVNDSAESNNAHFQPSDEEQQRPPQEDEGYRPNDARAPYRSLTPSLEEPQLMLIFKDGHTQAIRNFVLTPKEVIIMDDAASGRVPRISLSELNLPATEQTAHKAGLDFSPPST